MRALTKACLIFILTMALSSVLTSLAAGQEQEQTQAPAPVEKPGQPRFRIGFYWEGWKLSDEHLTDFLKNSQRSPFGFEGSVHTVYNIDVWATYRAYSDETKTSYYGNTDKFRINATSIGLVYRPVRWKIIEPFIGAGLEIYSYSEKIEGETELPDTSGNATGFHVQAGTYINIMKFLAAKLFYRYSSVKETFDYTLPDGTKDLELGGQEFGIGLLARF